MKKLSFIIILIIMRTISHLLFIFILFLSLQSCTKIQETIYYHENNLFL